jgi:hypothetical protein
LLDYHRGGDEGPWQSEIAAPGSFVYAHLFSAEPHAAGEQLLLSIGIEDYTRVDLGGMGANTQMTSHWFLHHLALRSTGG